MAGIDNKSETSAQDTLSRPETDEKSTPNQLVKADCAFPGPSLTGSGVLPPTAPRLMLAQGTGFSSFSSGPSPWLSNRDDQKPPWIFQQGNVENSNSPVELSISSGRQELQAQCAHLSAAMSFEKTVKWKADPEFRGYDDADYAPSEDVAVKSNDDSSVSYDIDCHGRLPPIESCEGTINGGQQLGQFDLHSLSSDQVLFYFGVLSLQETQLEPIFEYTQEAADGSWSAKLTLLRDSIKIPAVESLMTAKVEICRIALSILQRRYANWKVPDEPSENLTAFRWRWANLLQAYAEDMKHPPPELTKYVHKNGYRYQVDVGKVDTRVVTSLGHRKFYETEDQAIEAASHEVLYLLLIQELQGLQEVTLAASRPEDETTSTSSSQLAAPTPDSLLPAKPGYHFISNNAGSSRDMSKPVNDRVLKPIHSVNTPHRVTKATRSEPNRSNRGIADRFLSNFLPVSNASISTSTGHGQQEHARKWGVSPDQLTKSIEHLPTNLRKYEELCNILGLTCKLEITEHLKKASKSSTYTVWAKFENDPDLSRAGPIGLINGHMGSRKQAEEKCCKKVVKHLLNLVQEEWNLRK